jgi:Spy/CpxP family protein refolding chaperone
MPVKSSLINRTLLTLAIAMALLLSSVVQAQPAGKAAASAIDPEARLAQNLDLTPKQARELKEIRQRARQDAQALHTQIRAKHQALATYLTSPNATERGALALQKEINELQGRMGEIRIRTWFDMREKMTPEQIQKFAELRGQRAKPGPRGGLQPHREAPGRDGMFP